MQSKNKTLRVWEGFGPKAGQAGHKPGARSAVAVPTAGISVAVFDGVYYPPPQVTRPLAKTGRPLCY